MTTQPTTDLHPEYGYPDDHRAEILAFAELTSVAVAAQIFNVSKSSIYLWRNHSLTCPLMIVV